MNDDPLIGTRISRHGPSPGWSGPTSGWNDLLNDVGKERVMADILDWVDARVGAAAR